MVVASTSGGTFTPPPAFTQFAGTSFLWAGWHVVGASDPGPYTFSWVSPQSMIGWIGSYVGVDTASPADPTHPKTTTSGTSHSTNTTTPMSTATQYEMLIPAFQIQADSGWTAPARILEVADL